MDFSYVFKCTQKSNPCSCWFQSIICIHRQRRNTLYILVIDYQIFYSLLISLNTEIYVYQLVLTPFFQVKLDLSSRQEFGGGVDNRAGAFVMYNCARLATLFKHFEESVSRGKLRVSI